MLYTSYTFWPVRLQVAGWHWLFSFQVYSAAESAAIVTWHGSNASSTWRPRFPPCPPHNSLSVHKLEPAAITSRGALLVRIGRSPRDGDFRFLIPRGRIVVTPGGNQNRVLCARAIFYLPMTRPRKKTRRLHEGKGGRFRGGQWGGGAHVIQMGCHSFSLASPDSDSCLPPFRITHAREEATVAHEQRPNATLSF